MYIYIYMSFCFKDISFLENMKKKIAFFWLIMKQLLNGMLLYMFRAIAYHYSS